VQKNKVKEAQQGRCRGGADDPHWCYSLDEFSAMLPGLLAHGGAGGETGDAQSAISANPSANSIALVCGSWQTTQQRYLSL